MKKYFCIILLVCIGSCNTGQSDYLTTGDGVEMYYESYGSGSTALVLLHGWTVDSRSWDEQIEFFRKKLRVIVPDLAGFGKSGNRGYWTISQYGDDVGTLCVNLDLENIVLVGWSMGAPVALEAARFLGKRIAGVVLVDNLHQLTYFVDSTAVASFYKRNAENYKNREYWLNYFEYDTTLANRYVNSMPSDETMPEWWGPIISGYFEWVNSDLKNTISELSVPIRAINADQQETDLIEWNEHYTDFDVRIMDSAGHFLVWEYPQKFNEILFEIISEMVN